MEEYCNPVSNWNYSSFEVYGMTRSVQPPRFGVDCSPLVAYPKLPNVNL